MKKIINLSLMLLLCVTLVTGCGKKKDETNNTGNDNQENNIKDEINEDGTLKEEVNNNSGVVKEQIVEGITLKNVELTSTAYTSTLKIEALNNTNEDITLNYFKVYLKDKDGNNILGNDSFAVAAVYGTIKSKESKVLYANIDRNLSEVYSISYEMVK